MNDEDIKQFEISLLQLQRSALVDTQTLMQLLIDKGICTVDDIIDTRAKIEGTSPDVKRIDDQIIELGGAVPVVSCSVKSKNQQLGVLKELLKELIKDDNLL